MSFHRSLRRSRRLPPALLALALFGMPAWAQDAAPAPQTVPAAASAPPSTPPETPETVPAAAVAPRPVLSAKQLRKAEDAYLNGARWLERNRPEKAVPEFEHALKLNPNSVEAAEGLAVAKDHWASSLVQQAASRNLHGDNQQADRLLAQAALIAPQNAMVLQHQAQDAAAPAGPRPVTLDTLFPAIEPLDPEHPAMTAQTASDLNHIGGAIHIHPAAGHHDLDLRGDSQSVVLRVAQAFGLKAAFQGVIPSKTLRLTLPDADYATAMSLALRMGHLMAVPMDSTSLLVVEDTAENHAQYEHLLEETVYLPGMTTEQMNDVSNMARNIFDLKQTTVPKDMGDLVVRGSEDALHALNLTLASMMDGGAQVMLEVKLFSVDSSRLRDIGLSLPQQVGAYNVYSEAQALVTANQSTVDAAIANGLPTGNTPTETLLIEAAFLLESGLATSTNLSNTIYAFGGGKTLTGVYVGSFPTLNLLLNESETRTLDALSLRLEDRQPGTVRSGSKYPVITGSYSTGSSALTSALAGSTVNGVNVASLLGSGTTIPQFTFEDLGLTLKATPTIQRSGQISVHLDLKIEALSGQSLSSIPILTNRAMISDVTVRDGETATLVSYMSASEAGAVSGIPGLSELPGFQSTPEKSVQVDKSELIILLTPHITRRRRDLLATPRIAMHMVDTED